MRISGEQRGCGINNFQGRQVDRTPPPFGPCSCAPRPLPRHSRQNSGFLLLCLWAKVPTEFLSGRCGTEVQRWQIARLALQLEAVYPHEGQPSGTQSQARVRRDLLCHSEWEADEDQSQKYRSQRPEIFFVSVCPRLAALSSKYQFPSQPRNPPHDVDTAGGQC